MKKQTGFVRIRDFLHIGNELSTTIENIKNWEAEAELMFESIKNLTIEEAVSHIALNPPRAGVVALLAFVAIDISKTEEARAKANNRHSQPGGAREKQEKIRCLWATGNYPSRDKCAEEEHEALGMSFSSARKALRNMA